MKAEANYLDHWAARLAATPDTRALRRTLIGLADEVRANLGSDRVFSKRWRALGVTVEMVDLPGSGAALVDRSKPTTLVGRRDGHLRRRYTMAHEFAHLLLARAKPSASWSLDSEAEEALCEEFGSELLIGRRRLAACLADRGYPQDPRALLGLCSTFGVNLRPMFRALRGPMAKTPTLLIASRCRGHENRPADVDFRIDAAVGHSRVFVPRHQRLVSIGLEELAERAEALDDREWAVGSDWPRFRPRRVAEPVCVAETPWQLFMVGGEERLLVAAIDVGDIVQSPLGPTALAS